MVKWGPARIVMASMALFFLAVSLVGMSVGPILAMNGTGTASLDSYAALVSILASAFLIYLQIVSLYNRIILADMDTLLVSPLTGRVILLERVYGFVRLWWVVPLLGVAFIVAFGIVQHANLLYYPLAVIAELVSAAMLTAISILITLLLMLAARKRMSKDVFGIITSLVAVLIFVGPRLLVNSQLTNVPNTFMLSLRSSGWNVFPLVWFARALSFLAAGSAQGLVYVALSALVFIVCVALSLRIADRHLHDRLALLAGNTNLHRRRRRPVLPEPRSSARPRGDIAAAAVGGADARSAKREAHVTLSAGRSGRGRAVVAIVKKDLRRLRRTPIELLSFTISLVYVFAFLVQPASRGNIGVNPGGVFAILLVTMAGMGQMAMSSFGSEGQQLWLLLQSPAAPRQVVLAKWLYAFVPTFIWWQLLSVVVGYVLHLPFSVRMLFAIGGVWLIGGATMAVLPFGILHADYTLRRIGRRSLYVKRAGAWHMAVLLPYAALQGACFAFASLSAGGGFGVGLAPLAQIAPTVRVTIAVATSLLLAGVAFVIGWSIANEVWRAKIQQLFDSGELA